MENIKEIALEGLIDEYVKAKSAKEQYEALMQVIKDELGDRLSALNITGTKCKGYYVGKVKRLVFTDVPMSQAEELGATKKAIDTNVLKKLYEKGIKIAGIKSIQFVTVTEEKHKE